jgi:hypothetical protein
MNKDRFPILEMIACVSTFCTALVAVSLLVPNLRGEVAAGWAQAIGTVCAILGAVWIANDQYRRQKQEQLEGSTFEASIFCSDAIASIDAALNAICGLSTDIEPDVRLQFVTALHGVFAGAVADMSSVKLGDMRNGDAVRFVKAKSLLRKLEHGFAAMLLDRSNSKLDDIVLSLTNAKERIGKISQELIQSQLNMGE